MNTQVAARVIARIKAMYPHFATNMDKDPDLTDLTVDEWSRGLEGIELDLIDSGLEMVRRSGSDFAPSLPKFIQYCGGKPKPWWETRIGIEARGQQLGLSETNFSFFQPFRLAVLEKAKEAGEALPLEDKKPKELNQMPPGIRQLAHKMKIKA